MKTSYQSSEKVLWNGLTFRYSSPYRLADGRRKVNVALLGWNGHSFPNSCRQVVIGAKQPEEKLREKALAEFEKTAKDCADEWICQARDDPEGHLSLRAYVYLRWEEIHKYCRWARKAEAYRDAWEQRLLPYFGELQILKCTDSRPYVEAMENITHRITRKKGYSPDERAWWVFLGDVLRYAVEVDKLLTENPLDEIAKKCREKLSTLASRDLARRSLSREELTGLFRECLEKADVSDAYPAMLIQVMTGLSVSELLALNTDDWKRQNAVSYFVILKAYLQRRGEAPAMTDLLWSANAYRSVPCTEAVEALVRQQIRRLRRRGASGSSKPLFQDEEGNRLAPQQYGKIVKRVLSDLIKEGVKLDFVQRGPALYGEDAISASHGDILRSTAEHYFRNTCRMNVSEISAVLGKDREHTAAISYIDWGNVMVMMYVKEKMDRWHSDLIMKPGKRDAADRVQTRSGILLQATARSDDAVIRVHTAHGVECTIEPK